MSQTNKRPPSLVILYVGVIKSLLINSYSCVLTIATKFDMYLFMLSFPACILVEYKSSFHNTTGWSTYMYSKLGTGVWFKIPLIHLSRNRLLIKILYDSQWHFPKKYIISLTCLQTNIKGGISYLRKIIIND